MKKIRAFLPTIIFILVILFQTSISTTQVFAQGGVGNFSKDGVSDDLLNDLNPLVITGSDQATKLSTPGGIISRVLEFAFPIAGLILFVMIVWGGFETLSQAAGKKSSEAGRQRITAAVIGFGLLFSSYWIIRVIETVFGLKILF